MPHPSTATWTGSAGAVGVGWWILTVIGLHLANADQYDPVRQAISELVNGRFGFLLSIAFIALGGGTLAIAYGLWRSVDRARVGPLVLSLAGVLFGASGIFPTDSTGGPVTTSGVIHVTVGIAAFLLMIIVMFASARRFRGDPRWRSYYVPTLVWALCTTGAFFLFPVLGTDAFGIAQRIYVALFVSWLVATALRLRSVPTAVSVSERPA